MKGFDEIAQLPLVNERTYSAAHAQRQSQLLNCFGMLSRLIRRVLTRSIDRNMLTMLNIGETV